VAGVLEDAAHEKEGTVDPKLLTPILMGALVIFVIYRRMLRTFGRQTVSVGRMWVRIAILLLVACFFVYATVRNLTSVEALLAGILGGAALSYLGLKHTIFEVTPEGRFYTPHTYIGLVVSALFLGRLLYRFVISYDSAQAAAQAGAPGQPNLAAAYQNSPLTVAFFGVLITYYVVFNLGVLQKTKEPSQAMT
jgi:hypothetical protein